MPLVVRLLLTALAFGACAKYDKSAPAPAPAPTPPPAAEPAPAPPPPAAAATTIESATFAPALNIDLAKMTKTASGLYYRDLTVGKGAAATAGQTVSVHYAGTFVDGKQFDASGPGQPPLTFPLGRGRVIAGWDEGVAGIRVGGKRQLVIPPGLAYGAAGSGPIPPNAILVFTVELVGVQ